MTSGYPDAQHLVAHPVLDYKSLLQFDLWDGIYVKRMVHKIEMMLFDDGVVEIVQYCGMAPRNRCLFRA
jgi:hypothetical protein